MSGKWMVALALLVGCGPVHPDRRFHFEAVNTGATDVRFSATPLGAMNWPDTSVPQPTPWDDPETIHPGCVFSRNWDWTPEQIYVRTDLMLQVEARGVDYGDKRCVIIVH